MTETVSNEGYSCSWGLFYHGVLVLSLWFKRTQRFLQTVLPHEYSAMPFPCLMVRRADRHQAICAVETLDFDDLPTGDVLIEVACSSLNYKDALACQGHPGVVRSFPHVPGIDAAGRVIESNSPDFQPGSPVLVTGYGLGTEHWGGYSHFLRVPADWVVALPEGMSLDEAMSYGTAGFTAAQCVAAIQHAGIGPEAGEIVVTGASGGVGSLSVAILAKLGYQVVAVTGKPEQEGLLRGLGAKRILAREEVDASSDQPLLRACWAAAVDTVGGNTLATVLRSTKHRGCVAACGLVAGSDLPVTVYPFILRGVTLAGIDSAQCPRKERLEIWRRLANAWRIAGLDQLTRSITLAEVPQMAETMLAGKAFGRILVRPEA